MRDTVTQIIEDYIVDEIEEQSAIDSLADWDWESLRQNLSTHLLVDISHQKLIDDVRREDISSDDVIDWVSHEAESVYKV